MVDFLKNIISFSADFKDIEESKFGFIYHSENISEKVVFINIEDLEKITFILKDKTLYTDKPNILYFIIQKYLNQTNKNTTFVLLKKESFLSKFLNKWDFSENLFIYLSLKENIDSLTMAYPKPNFDIFKALSKTFKNIKFSKEESSFQQKLNKEKINAITFYLPFKKKDLYEFKTNDIIEYMKIIDLIINRFYVYDTTHNTKNLSFKKLKKMKKLKTKNLNKQYFEDSIEMLEFFEITLTIGLLDFLEQIYIYEEIFLEEEIVKVSKEGLEIVSILMDNNLLKMKRTKKGEVFYFSPSRIRF